MRRPFRIMARCMGWFLVLFACGSFLLFAAKGDWWVGIQLCVLDLSLAGTAFHMSKTPEPAKTSIDVAETT
ncbi:hypothetical protein Pan258_06310 [Symmachiella dynata]|uniref:hypothetical protein n=1 Tax=Symmachiella dynata TaxID=2527995 RepID=UPI00118AFC3B|nr:hypothetical protein [Symmachiella dynata]QDT46612.1 hypothetical protein Pan258_06310 [Symmachiella dynata]